MRRVLLVACLALLTACGAEDEADESEPAAESRVLRGTVTIQEEYLGEEFASCEGSGGYSDFDASTQVVLSSGDGDVLATARLGEGRTSKAPPDTNRFRVIWWCRFRWQMDVPESDFYVLQVSNRGEQTYSAAELRSMDYRVNLTIGD